MTRKNLVQNSPDWEVAFFTSIQSTLIEELAKTRPGLAESLFEQFDEDEILDSFVDCCNKMSVSICQLNGGNYELVDAEGQGCMESLSRVFGNYLSRKVQSQVDVEHIEP